MRSRTVAGEKGDMRDADGGGGGGKQSREQSLFVQRGSGRKCGESIECDVKRYAGQTECCV